MKKKHYIIIVLVVVIVLVVAVGVLMFDKKAAKAPVTSDMPVSTSTVTSTASMISTTTSSSATSVVISTSTAKNYVGKSFSFTYPSSWSVFTARPLMLTDFNGKYLEGGIIPKGGAQVAVVTTTIGGPVADIMTTELMGVIGEKISTVVVDGTTCQKAVFQADYAPGDTSQDISLYCSRGSELWKIYLSYFASGAEESTLLVDFKTILGSMKFL